MTQKYPAILFAMLDGKNYAPIIWKMIRPVFSKPFKIE
jgi:RNA ligase